MTDNRILQILLFPLALLFGIGVALRDFFYSKGLLKGFSFDLPIISVGNLSVGGAGKTPHVEYLLRLLKDYVNVATISRGYKRKTRGLMLVKPQHNADQVGDEPLQLKLKFPDVLVTVAESRAAAVPQILMKAPDVQVFVLDDAFQHRSIQPGLNILLTEYDRPYTRDLLLPAGRLREWRYAARRADIIILTKCPPRMDVQEKEAWTREIAPLPHQKLFFSYYLYGHPYSFFDPRQRLQFSDQLSVLLISAIARADYLMDFLEEQVGEIHALEYEDHHYFSRFDVGNMKSQFDALEGRQKVIITTEKDAVRLALHRPFLEEHRLPLFILPVAVAFHFDQGPAFDETIRSFLLEFKV